MQYKPFAQAAEGVAQFPGNEGSAIKEIAKNSYNQATRFEQNFKSKVYYIIQNQACIQLFPSSLPCQVITLSYCQLSLHLRSQKN